MQSFRSHPARCRSTWNTRPERWGPASSFLASRAEPAPRAPRPPHGPRGFRPCLRERLPHLRRGAVPRGTRRLGMTRPTPLLFFRPCLRPRLTASAGVMFHVERARAASGASALRGDERRERLPGVPRGTCRGPASGVRGPEHSKRLDRAVAHLCPNLSACPTGSCNTRATADGLQLDACARHPTPVLALRPPHLSVRLGEQRFDP